MYKLRRKLLSQNFLYNRTLINLLFRESSIGPDDIVLEIGSGKGLITLELLKIAKKVIAVEVDGKLVLHLKKFLSQCPNFEIYNMDFLGFTLPKFSYKVLANIPFSIEGKIIRKLLDSNNPPEDSYLIVMKEFAFRLSGLSHENQFSLKHKPWFEFSIHHQFRRSDFVPQPSVDAVMWRVNKRKNPLLPFEERPSWEKFIETGFGQGLSIRHNLKRILTLKQIGKLSRCLTFSFKLKPGHLSLEQWLSLYEALKRSEGKELFHKS